jgi:hypothetical protein
MSEQLTATPIDPATLGITRSTYRPYYTPRNGIAVKNILDQFAASPKTTLIPVQGGASARTLYNRVIYGCKWLAECHSEAAKYKAIRDSIRFRQTDRGVLLLPRDLEVAPITATPVSELDTKPTSWLDKFVEWVTTATEGQILDSVLYYGGILTITDGDEQALIKLGAQMGLELEIDKQHGKFRAMR